ncbi:MAG: hypothetical protein DRQ01_08835 [Ignavibacteriae bacterium]|nr:MAG: hypothetical protein DRQ01_08835 [Ignavibacteriota bacterium]
MKSLSIIIISLSLVFLIQGCLLFHSVSYKVKLDGKTSGTATVLVEDIRSDAINSEELDSDKKNLFEFILESDDFITLMKDEGQFITSKELFNNDGMLNGKATFSFDDITKVEGIVYEEPFYFLTINPEDSIMETNGEVIVSKDYKRIIWDDSFKILEFKMFSEDFEGKNLTGMLQFYENE